MSEEVENEGEPEVATPSVGAAPAPEDAPGGPDERDEVAEAGDTTAGDAEGGNPSVAPPATADPATDGPGADAATAPGPATEDDAGAEDRIAAVLGALEQLAGGVADIGGRIAAVEAAVFALGSTAPLIDAVAAVEGRLGEVARLGDRHNELIDKLHAENQALRKGELVQALAPLLRDLIRLADQMEQLDAASPDPGAGDASIAARQVLEILARAGVRAEGAREGDPFDPSVHQGIGRRPTGDPERDNTVAAVRRQAFVAVDGRVLRAAEVEVWRYEADAAVPADEGADPTPDTADDEQVAEGRPVAVPPPEVAGEAVGAAGGSATDEQTDNDTGGDV